VRVRTPSLKRGLPPLPGQEEKQFSIILFSGDMDKAMAAFTLACAAAGRGYRVQIFFTFWGAALLRRSRNGNNSLLERVFKTLLPTGPAKPRLSRMNFAGLGGLLFRRLLAQRQAQTLEELMALAMERKVNFIACEASLKILGLRQEELIAYEHLQPGDAEDFLNAAENSRLHLFI
jgi:peroxiredoxin family protein